MKTAKLVCEQHLLAVPRLVRLSEYCLRKSHAYSRIGHEHMSGDQKLEAFSEQGLPLD